MATDRRPRPLVDDRPEDERIGRFDLTRWRTRLGRRLARRGAAVANRTSPNALLAITALIGLLVVAGLSFAGGEVYDAVTEDDGIAAWDLPALHWSMAHRTPGLTAAINLFTQLGGPIGLPVLAAGILTAMIVVWRSRTPVVLMVIGGAGSLIITSVGKSVVGRVRPPLADAVPPLEKSPSFPSGHALNNTVIAGLVAYLLLRRLVHAWARALAVVLAACWAGAIGLSRVFLGHHWLTDVVFGWLVGLAWLGLVITAHRLFLTVRRSSDLPSDLPPDLPPNAQVISSESTR